MSGRPIFFHISLRNPKYIYTKMFYLYLQSSSASRQPKISNLIFFANTVHRVRRDPNVTLRKFSPNTTGHGLRITKRPAVWCFSIFLFEKYQFLLEIFYLHLESSSASRKWKNLNVVLFADSVHKVRRDPRMTLRKFSAESTGHGLRITKRAAVCFFSIFLFEKIPISIGNIYLNLESSSASRKWKNLNVVLFADSVHRVRRDPSVTLKKNFLRILPDKIQNTVRKL